MWWECKNCMCGGNNDASLARHREEKPDHEQLVEWESIEGEPTRDR